MESTLEEVNFDAELENYSQIGTENDEPNLNGISENENVAQNSEQDDDQTHTPDEIAIDDEANLNLRKKQPVKLRSSLLKMTASVAGKKRSKSNMRLRTSNDSSKNSKSDKTDNTSCVNGLTVPKSPSFLSRRRKNGKVFILQTENLVHQYIFAII